MNNMSAVLASQPCGDTVKRAPALNDVIVQASRCATCGLNAHEQLTDFVGLFADEVDRQTGMVCNSLDSIMNNELTEKFLIRRLTSISCGPMHDVTRNY